MTPPAAPAAQSTPTQSKLVRTNPDRATTSRLRRRYSAPEQLTLLGSAGAVVAVAYPYLMRVTGGHGLPCPLRTLTGVPCPLCGMTTAAVHLAAGDAPAAVAANPFILLLVACGVVTLTLLGLRVLGVLRPPRPWRGNARRAVSWLAGVAAAVSWGYQLHRFDLV